MFILWVFRDTMSSSNSDEELDMRSPLFNPTKALYAKNIKILNNAAQPLDNITKFEMTDSGEITIKPNRPKVIVIKLLM